MRGRVRIRLRRVKERGREEGEKDEEKGWGLVMEKERSMREG